MNVSVAIVALFFAGMGVAGLLKPAFVWAPFGVAPTTPGSRSEVRGVYGGFGIAVAVLLYLADGWTADLRTGVLVAMSVSLLGMAAGRAVSGLLEPKALFGFPGFFLLVEAGLAALLLTAR